MYVTISVGKKILILSFYLTVYAMFVVVIIIGKDALFILVDWLYVCDESLLGKKSLSYLILSSIFWICNFKIIIASLHTYSLAIMKSLISITSVRSSFWKTYSDLFYQLYISMNDVLHIRDVVVNLYFLAQCRKTLHFKIWFLHEMRNSWSFGGVESTNFDESAKD